VACLDEAVVIADRIISPRGDYHIRHNQEKVYVEMIVK
jgi:hypothetical protein